MKVPGPGWKPGEKIGPYQTWLKEMGPCNSITLIVAETAPDTASPKSYVASAHVQIGEVVITATRANFTVLALAADTARELGQMIDRLLRKGLV